MIVIQNIKHNMALRSMHNRLQQKGSMCLDMTHNGTSAQISNIKHSIDLSPWQNAGEENKTLANFV
jgi:hypothetical protein